MSLLTVMAPYDGAVLGELPVHTPAQLDASLAGATERFAKREGWLPAEQRVAVLRRAAALLESRAEEWARAMAREGGKPLVDSRIEVARAVDGLLGCVEALRTHSGRGIPMGLNAASRGRLAFTTLEPVGPVLAISAFNHPLNNAIHQIGPALAAGCPVRLKPAPATPLTSARLVALFAEAGLPEGWCELLLPADNAGVQPLAADPRIAFLSFIGSAEVGWRLRAQAAPGVRVALELGGVAPVLVEPDADVASVVPLLAKGGYYHAGQVCVSVQRVFAHRSLARRLADALAEAAAKLRVGDPTLEETQVGPMVRASAVDRVALWVDEARQAGAEVVTGGRRLGPTLYSPTLLWDPPQDARVSREEVFGPVVCVYPYDSLDEAVARANSVPAAFQAAIFTHQLDAALWAQQRLRAATVTVNDPTTFRVDWMPFGGLGVSGLGVGGIPYTFREMQVEKLCVIRSGALEGQPPAAARG
jgi:acyl-CoA reductase-like NAD-dependent aldehyde dehydrogenase